MKPYSQKFLGLSITIQVPESAEEFDQMSGQVGSCVESAVAQEVLHGYGGKFRNKFAEALEKETFTDADGKEFKVEWPEDKDATAKQPKKKDGTQTVMHISPKDYFDLVCAKTGKKPADFNALAQSVADANPFDLKASESGGSRVSKAINEAATELVNNQPDRAKRAAETLASRNEGLTIETDANGLPTIDSLARAMAVDAARRQREELAALGV